MKIWDETSFWKMAASVYQHELDAEFFADIAVKTAYQRYRTSRGFEASVQASIDVLQSLKYPDTLLRKTLEVFSISLVRCQGGKRFASREEPDAVESHHQRKRQTWGEK